MQQAHGRMPHKIIDKINSIITDSKFIATKNKKAEGNRKMRTEGEYQDFVNHNCLGIRK